MSSNSTSSADDSGASWLNSLTHAGENSIYLYTLPSVAVIILAVSACMFYRAIVVRRRFRRRLEEAIATGMLLPEQIVALQRREHVHLAEPTPKMWDVEYLKGAKGIDRWKEIMPLSATILPSQSSPDSTSTVGRAQACGRRRFFGLLSSSSAPSIESEDVNLDPLRSDQLQVTVLISLPSPPNSDHKLDSALPTKGNEKDAAPNSEDETGEVVFGVMEVPWNDGRKWFDTNDKKKSEK